MQNGGEYKILTTLSILKGKNMSVENRIKMQVEIFGYIQEQFFLKRAVSKQEILDKFLKDAKSLIDEALEKLQKEEFIQVSNEKYIPTGKPFGDIGTALYEKYLPEDISLEEIEAEN